MPSELPLLIEGADWLREPTWLQKHVETAPTKVQGVSGQVCSFMHMKVLAICVVITLCSWPNHRKTVMAILSYLSPTGSLQRQGRRLHRRLYCTKVRFEYVCLLSTCSYYSCAYFRVQMKHGMRMDMTNWFLMDLVYMAVLMGKG